MFQSSVYYVIQICPSVFGVNLPDIKYITNKYNN